MSENRTLTQVTSDIAKYTEEYLKIVKEQRRNERFTDIQGITVITLNNGTTWIKVLD